MTSIHPTAVIVPGAEIGQDVEVGPYCVIGADVCVSDGCRLVSHVVLDGWTTIGAGCRVFPFASLGTQTQDLKFRGGKTGVRIGERTTIREYVTVNAGTNEGEITRVGADCLLLACSHVAHACAVGDGVIMANSVGLAGEVTVEDQVVIGGLTGIHQFVRIGRMCMVGGLTKITKDCPPYMLVDGNPARVRGLNTIGMQRRGVPEESQKRLKQVYALLFRQGLSTSKALDRIRGEVEPCPEVHHLVSFIEGSERGIIKA